MMRVRPSKALAQQLGAFYGAERVLCGAPLPDLAHITEISSETTFESLLPLCANANKEMRLRKSSCLLDEIDPDELLIRAARFYHDGRFAKSYAANRLASHIFETRSARYSQAMSSAIYCLSDLRAIRQSALITHAVDVIRRLASKRGVLSAFWKGEFLSKLALILFDYGQYALALPIVQIAER